MSDRQRSTFDTVETSRPSLTEIRALLQPLLQRLEPRPVVTWLADGHRDLSEIGEVVGLMLQVGTILMEEVDVYLEASQLAEEVSDGTGPVAVDPAADLFDLPEEDESPISQARG